MIIRGNICQNAPLSWLAFSGQTPDKAQAEQTPDKAQADQTPDKAQADQTPDKKG